MGPLFPLFSLSFFLQERIQASFLDLMLRAGVLSAALSSFPPEIVFPPFFFSFFALIFLLPAERQGRPFFFFFAVGSAGSPSLCLSSSLRTAFSLLFSGARFFEIPVVPLAIGLAAFVVFPQALFYPIFLFYDALSR